MMARVALIAALVTGALSAGAPAGGSVGRCAFFAHTRYHHVVKTDRVVLAYGSYNPDPSYPSGLAFICRRSDGKRTPLADAPDLAAAAPAIRALRAVYVWSYEDGHSRVSGVRVVDAASGQIYDLDDGRPLWVAPRRYKRFVLRPRGRAAWARTGSGGVRIYACSRACLSTKPETRLLDEGRDIAPRSLRTTTTGIAWTHGGHVRTATF
jgi:hypothetical protein